MAGGGGKIGNILFKKSPNQLCWLTTHEVDNKTSKAPAYKEISTKNIGIKVKWDFMKQKTHNKQFNSQEI